MEGQGGERLSLARWCAVGLGELINIISMRFRDPKMRHLGPGQTTPIGYSNSPGHRAVFPGYAGIELGFAGYSNCGFDSPHPLQMLHDSCSQLEPWPGFRSCICGLDSNQGLQISDGRFVYRRRSGICAARLSVSSQFQDRLDRREIHISTGQ